MHISAVPRRLIATLVAAAAATFALSIGGALPAAAHTSLASSDPKADAILKSAPTQVTLRFSDEVSRVGATVRVNGTDGTATAGKASVAGATVTQLLVDGLGNGRYVVRWQVAAGDGHPITGTFAFSVSAPAPTAAPSPSPEPSASETPQPSATATARTELTSGGDDGSDGEGVSLAVWIAVAVAIFAGVGGSIVARRRKRDSTNV